MLGVHRQISDSPFISLNFTDQIGVQSSRAIHVGDDEKADKHGANAIGIHCWLVHPLLFNSFIGSLNLL